MRANTYRTLVAAATLAALACGVCQAQTSSAAPPEIQSAYEQMDRAAAQRDPNPILKMFAPNALFINETGHVMPFALYRQMVHDSIVTSQSIDSKTVIQSASVQPDGVTVTVAHRSSQTTVHPKTGILDDTRVAYVERDHWIQIRGQWKINRSRLLDESVMVNGKPYTGPK